jgi:hypothetical protein
MMGMFDIAVAVITINVAVIMMMVGLVVIVGRVRDRAAVTAPTEEVGTMATAQSLSPL